MPFEVSQEARVKADKCRRGYACLTAVDPGFCRVAEEFSENALFVDCPHYGSACAYHQSFGNGHLCTCPVRKEVFARYGV